MTQVLIESIMSTQCSTTFISTQVVDITEIVKVFVGMRFGVLSIVLRFLPKDKVLIESW